jgi:hypothetical protein
LAAAAFLLLAAQGEPKHFDPAVHEATRAFAYDEFLIVPVRVHLLRCEGDDALDCRLQEADVRRIFQKVNRIWNKAGIAPAIESIVTEPAVVPADFHGATAALDEFKATRPERSRAERMIHVYYVHRLPVNGVYQGRDAIFVKDTAALRQVRGGVDEPIPRVTSHELGHAMGGLSHREDSINLMASGTTGWSINDAEIEKVRGWAARQDWVLSPAAAFDAKFYEILTLLPGESALKERARRELK